MGMLGEYLGSLRRSRGVSIRQLASLAGLSPSTLSRWEAERTRPSAYELDALMNALNATASEQYRAWELLDAPRAVRRLRIGAAGAVAQRTTPTIPMSGELLKSMRVRRGWTLEQTALQLHVSPATLCRWERSESWPSTEQLHSLCYTLQAHPAETIALTGGRLMLRCAQKTFPTTLPALKELINDLTQAAVEIDPALEDLYYLSLEIHLWRLLRRNAPVLRLLITTYVRHALALVHRARLIESQTPAYRAIDLMNRSEPIDSYWLSAVHVIAKGAAESGQRPSPVQGVEVLRDWLPVAARLSRAYECWFRRDIAEYLSLTRSHVQALEASEYAMCLGQGLDDDWNGLLSHALVLLNVGRPVEALALLESASQSRDEARVPLQAVHEAVIWARALYGSGWHEEAFNWVERAHQLVQEQNLWQARNRVEAVRCQIQKS